MKPCPDCNGDGVVDKDTDDERQCPTCGGLGFVPDDDHEHEEIIKTLRDLPLKQGWQGQTLQGTYGVAEAVAKSPGSVTWVCRRRWNVRRGRLLDNKGL